MKEQKKDHLIEKRLSDMRDLVSESLYPPNPRTLMIEITNICNHRCLFCSNAFSSRPTGFINAELYERIVKEGFDMGIRELALYSTGESTLDKRLPKLTRFAKDTGYEYVYLTTNGSADFSFYKQLIESGLDSIKFSINAATRESYLETHGKDDFIKATENLKKIAEYRAATGLPKKIFASFIYTRQTRHEIESAKELIGPYVDDLVLLPCGVQGGLNTDIALDLRPGDADLPPEKGQAQPCYMLWSRAHVSWEGYLTICCVDYENNLVVSDLNTTSLQEAWHHPDFVKMRKHHLEQNLEGTLCYNCLYSENTPFQPLNADFASPPDLRKREMHRQRVQTQISSGE